MPIIFLILGAIVGANLGWWRWADRRVRPLRFARVWRTLLALFTLSQLVYLGFIASPRTSHAVQRWVPIPFVAATYLWSLLVLPVSLLLIGIGKSERAIFRRASSVKVTTADLSALSRRQWLSATAAPVPPLVAGGMVMRAMPQLSTFRVRSMQLTIPGLPSRLDGIRVAHVSDLHVGRYTRPMLIPRLVEAVNRLSADLVLFTGDLIDISLEDLPRGIDAMKQINPRSGMAIIEGNHDLIDNADEFDRQVRAAGLPLLVDQSMTVQVRGEKVQLLGARWGTATGTRRAANEAAFERSVALLSQQRDPAAFPILLAHHPHTFDAAEKAGFPLTLSGHTHGGQLMLTPDIGFGPMFYRYWSGVYQRNASQLVVNNGVGNWFPLRINAPAEIIDLTLRR